MSEDPFFIVKREVENSIQQISSMLKQRTNIPEKEQRRYTTDIQDRIHNTIADLDELDDTIKIVQGNPARFKIEKREMDDRKAFVNTTRRLVEDMQLKLQHGNQDKKQEPQLLGQQKNQRAIEQEGQMQQQIMQSQDRQMEEVAITIRNMREIGRVMGDELDDQQILLGEVETHVDSTRNKMDDGLKRMKEFINANADMKQQLTIICLVVVLIVLLVIVISL